MCKIDSAIRVLEAFASEDRDPNVYFSRGVAVAILEYLRGMEERLQAPMCKARTSHTRSERRMDLTVPYPPSANLYWRVARNMVYVSKEAKAYKQEVKLTNLRVTPLQGPVRLTARVYRPRKAGDLMNREKVLCDALQGVAYVDDNQIVEAHFFLFDDKANPRVDVTVEQIPS